MADRRLLVFGAGSQARYILETARQNGQPVHGLVDTFDNPDFWGRVIHGATVLGGVEGVLADVPPSGDLEVILAISKHPQKRALAARLAAAGYQFGSAIHPRAVIASTASVGVGCIINAGVTVETDASIGDHCILHSGTTIEHDNVLEDFVNIGPGVTTAGRVRFETGAIVYTGAVVIPDVTVGADAVVGAGAVLLRDVPAGATVVGLPAKERT